MMVLQIALSYSIIRGRSHGGVASNNHNRNFINWFLGIDNFIGIIALIGLAILAIIVIGFLLLVLLLGFHGISSQWQNLEPFFPSLKRLLENAILLLIPFFFLYLLFLYSRHSVRVIRTTFIGDKRSRPVPITAVDVIVYIVIVTPLALGIFFGLLAGIYLSAIEIRNLVIA
ncbi:hypothetical protein JDN40_15390 [Rhodomicrobium vannielii ATCC 17100]|uniref:hypothetical protein n=1 Tax=Rhodomicrobium vannielii TaxID=1069 RepID=UPI00191AAD22|nr:hypothetical protein [Rhodomicrobium vannielii]MBJ7535490.1 hypothetical protein [Rhodomicrobium vannielii ATCC 17100]